MNFMNLRMAGILFLLMISFANGQTLQEGQKKIEMKQLEGAKKTFKALLDKDANNVEALFYLGKVYWLQQKNDSAMVLFQKITSINPESPLGYVGQGYVYLNQKNDKDNVMVNKKALSYSKPKDPSTYMNIAEGYIYGAFPNLEKALENLEKAKEISKNNAKIFILTGDAYATKFDGKGNAMTNYESATDMDKNNVQAWFKIGELDAHSKNYKDAEPALKKARELDSLYVPVYPELAELFFYSNRLSQAKEMYRIYLSLCDYDLDAMVRYASFLYLSKDYENSIKEILKVQSKDTSYLVFNKFLGYSYYEVGKYAEGIPPLRKYINQTPVAKIEYKDYEYYYKMLLKTGQDSLGRIWMMKAYNLDTTKTELLGQFAEMLNKEADAIYKSYDSLNRIADTITKKADTALKARVLRDAADIFKQASNKYHEASDAYNFKLLHSIHPQAADYFVIGKDLYRAADYDNADSAFKRVTEIAPTYIPGYVYRVNINVYYKDTLATTGSAVAVCDTLIERLKVDSVTAAKNKITLMTCYKYLGTYYLKKKDCKKGKEYYLKAKELDPSDKQVLDILKGLNC